MKLVSTLAITLPVVGLATGYVFVRLAHRVAPAAAVKSPQPSLVIKSDTTPFETKYNALSQRAGQAEKAGDLVLAEKLTKERMSLGGGDGWGDLANLSLASIHEKQGRAEEVYQDYRRYFNPPKTVRLLLDPYDHDAPLLAKYGDLCLLHGDEREARRVYAMASRQCGSVLLRDHKRAEFMTPPGADAPLNVLRAYALSASAENRFFFGAEEDQSLHDIEVAVSLTPSDPFPRFYYGLILHMSNRPELGKAERDWAYRHAHGPLRRIIADSIRTDPDPFMGSTYVSGGPHPVVTHYPAKPVAATVPHPIDPLAVRMP